MRIRMYQVDAFSSRVFAGNPAAVCPLDRWLPAPTLQAIAAENNLPETAFYVAGGSYELRWFTPTNEVDLCGHATLASAHVIWAIRKETAAQRLRFHTKSGTLGVDRRGDLYALDFPARPPIRHSVDPSLVPALGARPQLVLGGWVYLCVYETPEQVRALTPRMEQLAAVDRFAVIATAPGSDCDFVSRFFAPSQGIPEDPVTGSAHCTLIPYWSKRLGKNRMFARQLSQRGGELWCEDRGDRVGIAGRAVKFFEGEIEF